MNKNIQDMAGNKTTAVEDVKWVFNGKSMLWMPKHKKPGWFRRGFKEKSSWDWTQLLIIPIVLAAVSFGLGLEQSRISDANSQRQHETDMQIAATRYANDQQLAADQQQEATLKTYLDDMSDLLLNHNLRKSKPEDEVSQVARGRTLTALRRLDPGRKQILLEFLYNTNLISVDNAIVNLDGADLSKIDLNNFNLNHINLRNVNLSSANLNYANLNYADLSGANLDSIKLNNAQLNNAILSGTLLTNANLYHVQLSHANLSHAQLQHTKIKFTSMSDADLKLADLNYANLSIIVDLSNANLEGAQLKYTNLSSAFLYNAKLSFAYLNHAILNKADLRKADLDHVDLSNADLSSANLRGAILIYANLHGTIWKNTTMPDGTIRP